MENKLSVIRELIAQQRHVSADFLLINKFVILNVKINFYKPICLPGNFNV